MGAERQTDRQTDVMKLIFAFRNFANAPEEVSRRSKYISDLKREI